MQSTMNYKHPRHTAIIMDGNGRWATRQGLPRSLGHRAGVTAVRRVVKAASDLGIEKLTLFAFSADNWRRPAAEVSALMGLLSSFIESETQKLVENGVRLNIIGRRDRLAASLVAEIARAEDATRNGRTLHLQIAFDYSSREAIARAASRLPEGAEVTVDQLDHLIAQTTSESEGAGAVDLLIRTGGEQRLSDFLLWECAYAELYFSDRMWPDFSAGDLAAAVANFQQRQRRFGGLDEALHAPAAAEAIA